ncbi:hypothetical protein [uncultured Bdellovibrio sp.]|uniref:hypothetical protein n=1 Tax=Bdellovibrio sp. HCB-162 TaxID=3394234 RepID=UPI0025FC37B4|nr:hypothetical protein [uncultured Bdellovibrio sp.]
MGHGLDAAQLEKTLQKILDNQAQSGKPASRNGGGASEDFDVDVDLDEMEKSSVSSSKAAGAAAASGESAAEVSQLRLSLTESHQKIETLQKQLKEALTAAEEAAASGGASAAGASEGGANSAANDELAGKVRDLEARLAEYEIISEDIADLSRYREENDQLKKELEALKAGGAKPAAAAAAPAPETPKVEVAPEPEPAPTPEVAAAPAEEPAPAAAEAPAQEPSSDLIDDELMREFAAAVEGQKALDKAAEKAGDGSEAAKAGNDESDKLMSEFENFVSKKS